jgi:hypothetical protein
VVDPPHPEPAGLWVWTCVDVGHSLTRSVRCQVLAAERGVSRIALLGEWGKVRPTARHRQTRHRGAARRGVAGRGVADSQAIAIAETLRSVRGRPSSSPRCDGLAIRSTARATPSEPTGAPDIPSNVLGGRSGRGSGAAVGWFVGVEVVAGLLDLGQVGGPVGE